MYLNQSWIILNWINSAQLNINQTYLKIAKTTHIKSLLTQTFHSNQTQIQLTQLNPAKLSETDKLNPARLYWTQINASQPTSLKLKTWGNYSRPNPTQPLHYSYNYIPSILNQILLGSTHLSSTTKTPNDSID